MKITNKLKAEILSVYNAYWNNYLEGDVEAMTVLLADEYTQVGSADTEVFYTKKDAVNFLCETIDQVARKLEMRNRSIRIEQRENLILIHELCDIYVLAENKWTFYSKARASTLIQYKKEGWKFIHQHSSFPDARTGKGENIAIDKIAEENRELREAVDRRTVELEQKNLELEIETTLEKVRTIAMGMREPADMLDVCKTISFQLQSLGVKEIRNVQTAIFYEQRGTYMNYEHYAKHDKTFITETVYTNNKIHNDFATKMLRGKGETFITHIKGDEVKNWIDYQKMTNVFIDKYLETASSLNYYWFSLGPVALGISTYIPLTENEINLFKRFLKVFELAYQRYRDIEKAEAHAREAQIEASLERVRAVAMSMNRSEDLLSICEVAFTEFKKLGFNNLRNAVIHILNDEKGSFLDYDYSDYQGGSTNNISYNSHPIVENYLTQIKKADDAFAEVVIGRNQLDGWKDFRRRSGQLDDPRLDKIPALYYYLYSIGVGDIGISTFKPIEKDQLDILKRFRNVFNLSYQRYSDIAQAEAQAREAKTEAALEKVRAVAMSMNKPDDLLNVCEVLFKEFHKLGFDEIRNAMINIHNDDKKTFLNYDYSDEIGKSVTLLNYNSHPVMEKQTKQSRKASDAFSEAVYKGKDLEAWKEFRRKYGEKDDPRINSINALYYYFYSIGNGTIGSSTFSPIDEEKLLLLKRFRNVFSLSYQRYSDIALAEAQAKESQIQLALERVRARTMAMHHSDELAETAYVLFQQFKEIDKEPKMITIGIMNENVIEFWVTDWSGGGSKINQKFHGSTDEPTILNKIYKAWENGSRSIVVELAGKNLQKWVDYRVKISGIPDDKDYSNEKGFVVAAFFSNGILSFSIYEPVSPETIQLLERFAGVFDITYTRFLDLQKAEAQAREAQIELGLERVRARAMAMQKSEELSELVDTVFKELTKLDFALNWCIINIINEPSLSNTVWAANPDIDKAPESYHMKFEDYPFHHAMMKGYQERRIKHVYVLEGQEKKIYDEYLFNETEFRRVPVAAQTASRAMEKYVVTFTFSNFGGLQTVGETPLSDANLDILSRFGKVFDLTYTRFNDLKLAEAQAREAQIEAALERVRSRSMGMQKSDELKEVIKIVFQQLTHLKINLDHAGFVVDYTPRGDWHFWIADERDIPSKITHPYFESVWANQFDEAKEKGVDFFTTNLNFEEKNKFYNELLSYVPGLPEASKEFYLSCPGLVATTVLMDNVGLYIENFSGIPYSEEENATLIRFGKVFQQTYTRFLDLQKAEAQARESQIEVALEKVRSKAMAMHSSEDLSETIVAFYHELESLHITPRRCGVGIVNKETRDVELSSMNSTEQGKSLEIIGRIKLAGHPVLSGVWENWLLQKEYRPVLRGEEINEYYNFLSPQVKYPDYSHDVVQYGYYFFFQEGGTYVWTEEELSEEVLKIYRRFTSVLSLTYKRYKELKEAEAQAKEAQIELALERVRARTMAMQNSNELVDTSIVLFHQLKILGVDSIRTGVATMDEVNETVEVWSTSGMSGNFEKKILGVVPANVHPMFTGIFNSWKNKEPFFVYELKGDELKKYYKTLSSYLSYPEQKEFNEREMIYTFFFSEGSLNVVSHNILKEEECNLTIRFTKVFGLVYTRFLDLQKAEAQARESKIEVSLERVRSKAMAMHSPNDLSETVNVFFKELKTLGIIPIRCGVGQIDEATRTTSLTTTTSSQQGDSFRVIGKVKQTGHPVLDGIFDHWKLQQEYRPVLEGEDIKAFYDVMNPQIGYPEYPEGITQYGNSFPFKEGFVFAWTENKLSEEELGIFRRFTSVLSLTYRRYMDLKEAEAQAKEAKIEASLEKVRSKTMAMRSSDELADTAAVVFQQLINLGIEPNRIYITIIKDETGFCEFWITDEDGTKVSSAFRANLNENHSFKKMYEGWKQNKKSISIDMYGEELQEYFSHLSKLNVPFKDGLSQTRRMQYIAYFSKGFIGVASPDETKPETIQLLERFAAVFNLTYTRFNDLQQAEAQNKIIQAENERKTKELEEARQLQLAMLPKSIPEIPNLDIAVYMKTATEVGGDYYDFKVQENGVLNIGIGDATGHGLQAGTMITLMKGFFTSDVARFSPQKFLEHCNGMIRDIKLGRILMSFSHLRFNNNSLLISSAGMPPIYYHHRKNNRTEELIIQGLPLGAMGSASYKLVEKQLNSGDTILLLTDGLPEQMNSNMVIFDYSRVLKYFDEIAENTPNEIINRLVQKADEWMNGLQQSDDVTFVVIRVK